MMKIMFRYAATVITGLILCFFLFFFCSCSEQSELERIFEIIEQRFEGKMLDDMKSCSQDSLYLMSHLFRIEYNHQLEELGHEKHWPSFIDTSFAKANYTKMDFILFFAFHKYIHDKPIDLEAIRKEVQESDERNRQRWAAEEKEDMKRLRSIIATDNKRRNIGDTINLLLKLEDKGQYNSIYFNGYPYSLDFSHADDTLKMTGILLDKYYDPSADSTDIMNLIFSLKITELSHDNAREPGMKPLKIGDKFNLSLQRYGRPME